MRILILCHAFNSLSQRLYVELARLGHELFVEFDINDAVTLEAAALVRPDLVLAPYLRRAIPEAVWRAYRCLIVHPGPVGDRGPSALDWAILTEAKTWGVTVLQAEAEMDAGPVWASAAFPMRQASKASLYRNEVTEGAVTTVLDALHHIERGAAPHRPSEAGVCRPLMRQADRAADWARDDTATVLRKIRTADGWPGLRDGAFFLSAAHPAPELSGKPGTWLARRHHAVARATADGAVWIEALRPAGEERSFKRPAASFFPDLPEAGGFDDIAYQEAGGVGYLHFPFANGAMSTEQCHRLTHAFTEATRRDTRVIVLMGGADFWSNGIHLGSIEAADSPADESLANIEAMDDLCLAILTAERQLTVSAMQGNAGAGGVYLALAADAVWARRGIVLSPHYKDMGNLYGSEYWTYLLPKRTGDAAAARIMVRRLPVGTTEAKAWKLIDDAFGDDPAAFRAEVRRRAEALAIDPDLAVKRARRAADEAVKPLAAYRAEELARLRLNFYGFDPSYHVARYNFIHKIPHSRTPLHLAPHRRRCQDRPIGAK